MRCRSTSGHNTAPGRALTMPTVAVGSAPNGQPSTSTHWPGMVAEVAAPETPAMGARSRPGMGGAPSISSRARSACSSMRNTRAGQCWAFHTTTGGLRKAATTCAAVAISRVLAIRKPEPTTPIPMPMAARSAGWAPTSPAIPTTAGALRCTSPARLGSAGGAGGTDSAGGTAQAARANSHDPSDSQHTAPAETRPCGLAGTHVTPHGAGLIGWR